MATTTTRLSLRKPATTDTVNVETDLNDNYDTIDANTGFQSVTSFPSSPYAGMCVYRSDTFKYYVYNGTSWRQIMIVEDMMDPIYVSSTSGGSFTNKTYGTAPSAITNVNTTFTAPASGSIYVTVTGTLEAATADTGYISYEVRETNVSGAVVSAAEDDIKAVAQQDGFNHQGSTRSLVTGLTAGNTYFIRLVSRCVVTSYEVFFSGLLIEPVL